MERRVAAGGYRRSGGHVGVGLRGGAGREVDAGRGGGVDTGCYVRAKGYILGLWRP